MGWGFRATRLYYATTFILLVLTGPAAAEPLRLGGFTTWDSGVYPGAATDRIQWLDEATVVFRGDILAKPETVGSHFAFKERIVTWHLGDPPTAIDDTRWDATKHAFLCAADGELAYSIAFDHQPDGVPVMRVAIGPPDQLRERLIQLPVRHPGQKDRGLYPEGQVLGLIPTCEPDIDPSMRGRRWAADADAHYRLDFGLYEDRHQATDIRLESRTRDRPPRTFNLTSLDADASCTRFASFTGLFYLSACTAGRAAWETDQGCYRAWSLDPAKGVLRRLCVAYDPYLAGTLIDLVPTRVGIVFTADPPQQAEDAPRPGVYRAAEGENRLLFTGFTGALSVSPSGCRLAFAHAETRAAMAPGTPGRYTIVAVDLCR
jgi:hypothetical protein